MADIKDLEPLIGKWKVEASFRKSDALPEGLSGVGGSCTFEWALGGTFIIQRSDIDIPEAPDTLAVLAPDPRSDDFNQHYFDSRTVIRVFAMTFSDGVWTLERREPDFSSLDFWQRFSGTFSEDGSTMNGEWEMSEDEGSTWFHDIEMIYTRA